MVLAACLAFAGCKKECGYITVEIGSQTRVFQYNDSLITGTPTKEYRLEYSDKKLYYFTDYPISLNKYDSITVKDCQSIKL